MPNPQPDPARTFFLHIVEPTARDFLNDPGSERLGFLASIVLAHMADHFLHARPPEECEGCRGDKHEEDKFRNRLCSLEPAFALLHNVTTAGKHARLKYVRNPGPDRRFSRADQVRSVGARLSDDFTLDDDASTLGGGSTVFVNFDEGTREPLYPAVRRALAMWRERLGLPPD